VCSKIRLSELIFVVLCYLGGSVLVYEVYPPLWLLGRWSIVVLTAMCVLCDYLTGGKGLFDPPRRVKLLGDLGSLSKM
jgi:hypothetical protein